MLSSRDLQLAVLEAIRQMPPDAPLQVTLAAGDVARALEQRAGPEILTTEQASELLGCSEDMWRRWAASGKISGAYQLAAGAPWRLPRSACEAFLAQTQSAARSRRREARGRGPRRRATPETPRSNVGPTSSDGTVVPLVAARGRRMPNGQIRPGA